MSLRMAEDIVDKPKKEQRKIVKKYCKIHGLAVMSVGTPHEVAKWLGVKLKT